MIAVTNALTLLEIFLINKHYVACEHLTIADISILANVTLLEISVEFDLSSYPNIWLWIQRLRNELPYYEWLTKMAHDELRSLIQSVRDANDEWSSPLPRCAFTPSSLNNNDSTTASCSTDCIEQQRRQYKRLFSNDVQTDVARIMAAVIPTFIKNKNSNSESNMTTNTTTTTNNNNNNTVTKTPIIITSNNDNTTESIPNMSTTIKSISSSSSSLNGSFNQNNNGNRMLTTSNVKLCSNNHYYDNDRNLFAKRIRLTIEPNTGHFDSSQSSSSSSIQ